MTVDPLNAAVQSLRPADGWAQTLEGQGTLVGVQGRINRDGVTSSTPPSYRRSAPLRAVATAFVVLAVATLGVVGTLKLTADPASVSGHRPANGTIVTESSSGGFAFDVTDLETIIRHSSDIFVGRVSEVTAIDDDAGTTSYLVVVETAIKGARVTSGEVEVRQKGYVDSEGTTHVIEGQQLLATGQTYLLAVNFEARGEPLTVNAGPLAIRPISGQAQRQQLIVEYEEAAARA